jgi:hypothetical protein
MIKSYEWNYGEHGMLNTPKIHFSKNTFIGKFK